MPKKSYRVSNKPLSSLRPKVKEEVKKIARRQARINNPRKEIRFNPITSQFITNGTVAQRVYSENLTNIALGDQVNQREGYRIRISRIEVDYYFSNAATSARQARIVLFTDVSRDQTLDTTTYANLMDNSSFAQAAPTSVNSNYPLWYNDELMRVHKRKSHLLSPGGADKAIQQGRLVVNFPDNGTLVEYEKTNDITVSQGKKWLVLMVSELGQTSSAEVTDFQYRVKVFFRSAS